MRPSRLLAALVLPVALLACGGGGDSDDLVPDGGGGAGGTAGEDPLAVHPRLTCDATTLDFGFLPRRATKTLSVRCRNDGDGPWTLAVEALDDVAVVVTPSPLVQPGESWDLSVTWTPDATGPWAARLSLVTVDGTAVGGVDLRGEGVGACMSTSPERLDFGFVQPGSTATLGLTVTNRCPFPVAVTGLVLDASSSTRFGWEPYSMPIEIPAAVEAPGQLVLYVTMSLRPEDAGSRFNAILVLNTDDASTPRLDLLATGFGGGPLLSCTPNALDFGRTEIGVPVAAEVTCTNTGTGGTLELERLELASPEFAAVVRGGIAEAGYAVGEGFVVDITYTPLDDGIDADDLWFISNALNGPGAPPTIDLEGRGVDAD